jgi:hypothetical protein
LQAVGQRLNHQEIHFNGVDDVLGGVRAHLFAEKRSRRSEPIERLPQSLLFANSTDRFFPLDAAPEFLHSEASSIPAQRRVRRT